MSLQKEILEDALKEESPRDYLYGYFSDMYKDANGVRPRCVGREDYSLSCFASEIAKMHNAVADQIRKECNWVEQEEKEEAEHQLRVKEVLVPFEGYTLGELGLI
jgi:hypothetical protein